MARQEIPMVINLRQNKNSSSFVLSPANSVGNNGGGDDGDDY